MGFCGLTCLNVRMSIVCYTGQSLWVGVQVPHATLDVHKFALLKEGLVFSFSVLKYVYRRKLRHNLINHYAKNFTLLTHKHSVLPEEALYPHATSPKCKDIFWEALATISHKFNPLCHLLHENSLVAYPRLLGHTFKFYFLFWNSLGLHWTGRTGCYSGKWTGGGVDCTGISNCNSVKSDGPTSIS